MKKITVLLLFVSLTISAQKIDRKTFYKYSDDIEFRIYGMTKTRSVDIGAGNFSEIIMAEKGQRFVNIIFEFKNNSSEAQEIDFENIYILDKNDEPHEVYHFLLTGVRFTGKSMQRKIKPNQKFKVITIFAPPIDKKDNVKTLIMNKNRIDLKFKK